jgi:hypothetical protein
VAGATLIVVGLVGFIADASFDTGDQVQGGKLVIFEVNGVHNVVHIGLTIAALAFAAMQMSDREPAADRRLV